MGSSRQVPAAAGRRCPDEGPQAGRPGKRAALCSRGDLQTGGMEGTASQDPASARAGEGQEVGARPVHARQGTGTR